MKKLITLFSFLLLLSFSDINAQNFREIVLPASNLYADGKTHNIIIRYEVEEYEGDFYITGNTYNVTIDDAIYEREFDHADGEPDIQIVDLDKADNFTEFSIRKEVFYYSYYDIYRYDGHKIEFLGEIPSLSDLVFHGDNTLTSPQWMGFWECKGKFEFKDGMLLPVVEDEYPISMFIDDPYLTVTEQIDLYPDKDLLSPPVVLNPGEKAKIIKADIREICEGEEVYGPFIGSQCNWYYMETDDGKKGWVRLMDFQDKVEMLPWAG